MNDLLIRAEVLAALNISKWKLRQLLAANEFLKPIRLPMATGEPGRKCYWSKRAVLAWLDDRMTAQVNELCARRKHDPFGR